MTKEYKGFLDEAIKLGAVPVSGKATIPNTETHKIGDNYIKVGKEVVYEWTYAEGADVHEANMAMDAYTRADAAYSLREQKAAKGIIAIEAQAPATVATTPPPAASSTPPAPTEAPPQPPEAPQASGAVETHEILTDCSISHQVTGSGIHHLLVKGGKFKKYGVRLWPEKAAEFINLPWESWEIGQEYGLPDDYSEAVIQMKPDGKPDRCVGLR